MNENDETCHTWQAQNINEVIYSFIEEMHLWSDQLPEICRSKFKTTNV